jgi:DNA-binding FrmR family transcriptional regulator
MESFVFTRIGLSLRIRSNLNKWGFMSVTRNVEKKQALLARLSRAEGQLRGVRKLIEEDADCEKIVQQLSAARKALDGSFYSMVACMIEEGNQPIEDVTRILTKYA